jgi:1D-myo-inositol 3-kinase
MAKAERMGMQNTDLYTDVLAVGHYCHDILIGKNHERNESLGGGVSYATGILRGLDLQFKIASKVGGDFKYASLCAEAPVTVASRKTTSFVDDYSAGERVEFVSAVCEEIFPQDIGFGAKVSMICGIMNETPVETALKVIQSSVHTIADLQGILRRLSPAGKVVHVRLEETPYYAIIDRFTLIKASKAEAEFLDLDQLRKKTKVIITDGENGSVLYDGEQTHHFKAPNVLSIDPTGAGDSFLAGLAYGLVKGFTLEKQMEFASFCGSLAVQQIGIPKIAPNTLRDFLKS